MKAWMIIALFLLCSFTSSYSREIPPIVRKLYNYPGLVITFQQSTRYLFPELNANKGNGQVLIKSSQKLYLGLPGTGQLYELLLNKDSLTYNRIDSTFYEGYNFGCLYFAIDSALYSFGGEGFWRANGDLRFFNELLHEWNAIRVTEPISKSFNLSQLDKRFFFLDTAGKELWITGPKQTPHFLQDLYQHEVYPNQLWSLHLSTGVWTYHGKVDWDDYRLMAQTPWGLFTREKFLDPLQNALYKFTDVPSSNHLLGHANNSDQSDLSYCIGNKLYWGSYAGEIDSMSFNPAFIQKQGPLYHTTSFFRIVIWGVCAIFLLAPIVYFRKRLKKRKNTSSNETPDSNATPTLANKNETHPEPFTKVFSNPLVYRSGSEVKLLGGNELKLLSLLYNHSLKGWLTSIDQINDCLGTVRRTLEVQKRMRGDCLNAINEKVSLIANINYPIVEKKRSEQDKRSFEYFIPQEHLELVGKLLQENGK